MTKEINVPRYPSLKGILSAKKKEIKVWGKDDLSLDPERIGLDGSPTLVIKIFTPEAPPGGEILDGDPPEVAARLLRELKGRRII